MGEFTAVNQRFGKAPRRRVLKGDKGVAPEPGQHIIEFPGGAVEVTRLDDGTYWAHIIINRERALLALQGGLRGATGTVVDSRLDWHDRRCQAIPGLPEHANLTQIAVRIRPMVPSGQGAFIASGETIPNGRAGGGCLLMAEAPMIAGSALAERVVTLLRSFRFALSVEKTLQGEIARVLAAAGIPHVREKVLGPGSVIDFLVGADVGLEVKIKGQRKSIYRQCLRYCRDDAVGSLILATNAAMGMPAAIAGKPVYVVSLGRSWL